MKLCSALHSNGAQRGYREATFLKPALHKPLWPAEIQVKVTPLASSTVFDKLNSINWVFISYSLQVILHFVWMLPPPPSYSNGNKTQLSPVICLTFFYCYSPLPWLADLNPYLLSGVCSLGEISRSTLWNKSKDLQESEGKFQTEGSGGSGCNSWGWQGANRVICPTETLQPSLQNHSWQLWSTQASKGSTG